MKRILIVLVVCGTAFAASMKASGQAESKPKGQPADIPKAEQSATQHKIVIGGATISYTATAGTLIVRNARTSRMPAWDTPPIQRAKLPIRRAGRSRLPTTAGPAPPPSGFTWGPGAEAHPHQRRDSYSPTALQDCR